MSSTTARSPTPPPTPRRPASRPARPTPSTGPTPTRSSPSRSPPGRTTTPPSTAAARASAVTSAAPPATPSPVASPRALLRRRGPRRHQADLEPGSTGWLRLHLGHRDALHRHRHHDLVTRLPGQQLPRRGPLHDRRDRDRCRGQRPQPRHLFTVDYKIDRTAPSVTLTSGAPDPTNGTIGVTATFSEPVYGFSVGDISVTNGSAGSFTGSDGDTVYTYVVTATADGLVTTSVPAAAAADAATNPNTVSNTISRTYDATAPSVTLTSGAPDPTNGTIAVTATFSEPVYGFSVGDISVTNGSAGTFTGSNGDTVYTYVVTATADGLWSRPASRPPRPPTLRPTPTPSPTRSAGPTTRPPRASRSPAARPTRPTARSASPPPSASRSTASAVGDISVTNGTRRLLHRIQRRHGLHLRRHADRRRPGHDQRRRRQGRRRCDQPQHRLQHRQPDVSACEEARLHEPSSLHLRRRPSGLITVQRQTLGGSAATVGSLTVYLSSTSGVGLFRDAGNTTDVTSVVIPDGSSSVSFLYQDTLAGNPTIKAADQSSGPRRG